MPTPREIAQKVVEAIFDRSEAEGRVIHKDQAVDEAERVISAMSLSDGKPLTSAAHPVYIGIDPASQDGDQTVVWTASSSNGRWVPQVAPGEAVGFISSARLLAGSLWRSCPSAPVTVDWDLPKQALFMVARPTSSAPELSLSVPFVHLQTSENIDWAIACAMADLVSTCLPETQEAVDDWRDGIQKELGL